MSANVLACCYVKARGAPTHAAQLPTGLDRSVRGARLPWPASLPPPVVPWYRAYRMVRRPRRAAMWRVGKPEGSVDNRSRTKRLSNQHRCTFELSSRLGCWGRVYSHGRLRAAVPQRRCARRGRKMAAGLTDTVSTAGIWVEAAARLWPLHAHGDARVERKGRLKGAGRRAPPPNTEGGAPRLPVGGGSSSRRRAEGSCLWKAHLRSCEARALCFWEARLGRRRRLAVAPTKWLNLGPCSTGSDSS
jgi:hypothetical protein